MQAVELPECDVLCVYGPPNSEVVAWLDENPERYVVVISEGEIAPSHVRMRSVSIQDEESLKKVAWEFVFLKFSYLGDHGAFAKMQYFQEGVQLVASDYKERGLDLLANFMQNSELFDRARDGKDLFGSFSNVPAIICGAGPSLEEQIPYLRSLKDRALLFAGGTTLSSLSQFSIRPHFGGLVDPHPPVERLFAQQAHEVPLFFQARAHPTLLKQMQGPLLKIPGSDNDFFESDSFDAGWNVTTFLVALATHLGCSPIILVGVDLAQREEKCYAGDLNRTEGGELIEVEEGLSTRRDWLFAANWLSEFAKKHPEVEWVNASDGLNIEGIEKKQLSDISFERENDLTSMIHGRIQGMEQGVFPDFQSEALKASFQNVGKLCEQMLLLLEKIFPEPPEKNGEYILLELELEKEMAMGAFLKPVWDRWKYVFMRQISNEIPEAYGIGLNQWLFIKGICDDAGTL
ncbi:MAG: DUF115 domain-containing protein [Simkaniaceae bacterium]|nr:DUF115 domain-containing protein [Candidatus Sacchlamyda saccharinae]